MEDNEALLSEWVLLRFSHGIAHFEDIFTSTSDQIKETNANSQRIRKFFEDLATALKTQNATIRKLKNGFQEDFDRQIGDGNLAKNFEGVFGFIEAKVQASQSEGVQIDEVVRKLNICQRYTDQSLKKNTEDLHRHLELLRQMFKRYREQYLVYLRICKAGRMDYLDAMRKMLLKAQNYEKLVRQMEGLKGLVQKKGFVEGLNATRMNTCRKEIEQMLVYFKRADRKITKYPRKKAAVLKVSDVHYYSPLSDSFI